MFLKELLKGIKVYAKAIRIIKEFSLWNYFIVPGIISLILTFFIILLGIIYLPDLSNYLNENMVPEFLKGNIMFIITTIFLWIFLLLFTVMIYKYIVLIFFSPILSFLSEKIEKLVYRQPQIKFKFKNFISDILRGLIINIRSIIREIIFTFFGWSLIIIPGIGALLSTILIFSIQAYYGGSGLVDYTLERKRFSIKQSINYSKEHRWNITGIGVGFMLLIMIPIIGWATAPTFGTVAATLNTIDEIDHKRNLKND